MSLLADAVAPMAEMFTVLILGLEAMNEESSQLDLEVNLSKTRIQASESIRGSSVPVPGHQVNLADTFVCLGSSTDHDGECDTDIRRRIEIARSCMNALDRGILADIHLSSNHTPLV